VRETPRSFPASAGQRLLWLMEHYRGGGGILNCPLLVRFHGTLDIDAITRAVAQLTARHESLRTTFSGTGRHLRQFVHEPSGVAVEEVDLSGGPDPEQALREAIQGQLRAAIDATRWPVRVTCWRLAADDHVVCFNMHHLVGDGWSCGIIFDELVALYAANRGHAVALPEPAWQFAQFADWQAARMQTDAFRAHQDYWREQLAGAKVPSLPFHAAGDEPVARRIGRETIALPAAAADGLRQLARARRTTIFTVLLSLYYLVLRQLTGDSDLAVGSVFANRVRPELQRTVGPLAHMIVLRTLLRRVSTFGDVLRETHANVAGAFLHQEVPYHTIGSVVRDAASARVDDVVFQMVAKPLAPSIVDGVQIRALEVDGMGQRFGCECAIFPIADGFTVALSYDERRLDGGFARALVERYAAVAAHVASDPDARLTVLAA
jgi:hypothetical protein